MKSAVLLTVLATALAVDMRIFLTSIGTTAGNYGGLAAMDEECRLRAGSGGFENPNFVALASQSGNSQSNTDVLTFYGSFTYGQGWVPPVNMIDRVDGNTGTVFTNFDGSAINFYNKTTMFVTFNGKAIPPILVNPLYTRVSSLVDTTSEQYRTGTGTLGSFSQADCHNWLFGDATPFTSLGVFDQSTVGSVDPATPAQWVSVGNTDCNYDLRFVCIEQQNVVCAFVTTDPIALDGTGVAQFDQFCQDQAPLSATNAGVIFKAVLSTSTKNAFDVFPGPEGSYLIVNAAGTVLNSLRSDFFEVGTWDGVGKIIDGAFNPQSGNVWTGMTNTKNGAVTTNCNDFTDTSAASTSVVGEASASDATIFNTGTPLACDQSARLYCLQTNNVGPASVHGDPHFSGFDGSRYNFDGADAEVFAIVSDVDFALNAEFSAMTVHGTAGTWMTKIGVVVRESTMIFDPRYGVLVNGNIANKFTADDNMEIDIHSSAKGQISRVVVTAAAVGYVIDMKVIPFTTVEGAASFYLDVKVSLIAKPVRPHGVLGQTARFIAQGVAASPDSKIEGEWTDYIVRDGIIGTDFVFSSFAAESHVARRAAYEPTFGGFTGVVKVLF
jgi:hypothetical protein